MTRARTRFARPAACGLAVFLWAFAALPPDSLAAGRDFHVEYDDMAIVVDSRWAGCGQGGYWPIRISVTNTGPPRTLTFRFDPKRVRANLPVVEQTVTADQNATVRLTLSVPMVGSGAHGVFVVLEDGDELPGLMQSFSFSDVDAGSPLGPALLVISPTHVDRGRLDEAVLSVAAQTPGAGMHTGRGASTTALDSEIVPPAMLPDRWIDYSGLDLVAIALDTLASLPDENRTAIVKWVQCGGTLLVFGVGESAWNSKELARLLATDDAAATRSDWQPADPHRRVDVPPVAMQDEAAAGRVVVPGRRGRPVPPPAHRAPHGQARFLWPGRADTFARRDLMLGTVVAFRENPFPGSRNDWAWLLNSVGPERYRWTARHGISARKESSDFLNFLVPGVKGVPVYAFLTLITLFTIAIGPLNYFFLWKRKRLYLLVLTIPAVAFVTSLSLFGYSAVAHGFGVKARARSVTLLDQRTNIAVTTNRLALFAGLAPSHGMRFSSDTAVFPIWPQGRDFENGTVDWTEAQDLRSGWLRSRTRTQFLTVSHRTVRERLIVGTPSGGSLDVSNGFEWDVEALVVAGADGTLYVGRDLPAGETQRLSEAAPADLREIAQLLRRHPLELPGDVPRDYTGSMFDADRRFRRRMGGMMRGAEAPVRYSESRMERTITRLTEGLPGGDGLPKNSYLAIFRENPGINFGLEKYTEQAAYHVVVGHY